MTGVIVGAMSQARGVSSKIWRTVVMAGAMLSTQACGGSAKKPTPVAPEATQQPAAQTEPAAAPDPATAPTPDPAAAADPCAGTASVPAEKPAEPEQQASDKPAATPTKKKKRPRGSGDKPVGRGFVLA